MNFLMTFYRKSSFWNNQDWLIYIFIVVGGSIIFSNGLQGFVFSFVIMAVVFGIYFGVNVFTKKQLYAKEIGLELGLDETKKELQIGDQKIKLKSIKSIRYWYIYRIGWKIQIETNTQKLAVISPDVKVVILKLKELLDPKVFADIKLKDPLIDPETSSG